MRRFFGNLLLFAGAIILLVVALFAFKSRMTARQMAEAHYLVISPRLHLPVPTLSTPTPYLSPASTEILQPTPTPAPLLADTISPTGGRLAPIPNDLPVWSLFLPFVYNAGAASGGEEARATPLPVAETPALETAPGATPELAPLPESQPIIHLVIPRLKIDRAVVPLGVVPDAQSGLDWNTDYLFATRNRPDLVGHLVSSYYPGQGGNIVLVGHNYDQGTFRWKGVFVKLKSLQPGDEILVYTEGGQEFKYQVVLIKQIPWRKHNGAELAKHNRYIGETGSEQLTLVTCGGANAWPWPARIYVVAVPVK